MTVPVSIKKFELAFVYGSGWLVDYEYKMESPEAPTSWVEFIVTSFVRDSAGVGKHFLFYSLIENCNLRSKAVFSVDEESKIFLAEW